jgi:hypothetical protein
MKNWEYYKDDIKRYGVDRFAIKKDGTATKCYSIQCKECKFINDCVKEKTEFLYQEHEEPIKLSRLEYELLKYYIEHGYLYIARDNNKALFAYDTKPRKIPCQWWTTENIKGIYFDECFKFIKWEDEESYEIQDILNNCEVIENEKI